MAVLPSVINKISKPVIFLSFVTAWWWPAYIFLFPLMFDPFGETTRSDVIVLRAGLVGLAILGSLLFELRAHPNTRLADLGKLPQVLRRHPAAALALAYGLWRVFAAFFSLEPAVALTGSVFDLADGALLVLAFSLSFVLIYSQACRDPKLVTRLCWAFVAAVAMLSILAVIEVMTRHGLIYNVDSTVLPMATFPQRGHLAGFLVSGAGVAAAFWYRAILPALPSFGLAVLALGLTYNRAALLALATGPTVLGFFRPRRFVLLALVAVTAIWGGLSFTRTSSGGEKELQSTSTFHIRLYFWKAAFRATFARPLTGWGGGQFYMYWADYLSEEELKGFFWEEYSVDYLEHDGNFFLVRNASGDLQPMPFTLWKAHNQFLEVSLMGGLVGLALYLALLVFGLRHLRSFHPAALGLLVYHVFLLFWFVPPEAEGALWALWAVAVVRTGPSELALDEVTNEKVSPTSS